MPVMRHQTTLLMRIFLWAWVSTRNELSTAAGNDLLKHFGARLC